MYFQKFMENLTERKRLVLKSTFFSLTVLFLFANKLQAEEETRQPNILIVFTDDQGYGDLSCYGSESIFTPNIDRLAEEGTRFTSFYVQPVCGPSRSALLTGRYPSRSKGWSMPADEVTFAEKLQEVGYQTACIGKWDVSNRKPIIERMPLSQGFDYYFGTLGANDGGRVTLYRNNEQIGKSDDMAGLTSLYTREAIEYLKCRRDEDRPFLLYLAHTMVHMNIDATPHFKGDSDGGLYGDAVEEIDHETGRLLGVLERLGLRKNTLVIFTSDNGPWSQSAYIGRKRERFPKYQNEIFWGDSGPLRNGKGSCYEGGYRVPCIISWPDKVPAGRVSGAIFASIDLMPTFASLAGFNLPDNRIIDGVDQSGLLLGKSQQGARESFYYARSGYANAVRMGKWKYLRAKHQVYNYARDKDREEVEELYDLEDDIGEQNNLAEKYPEKLKEMREFFRKRQQKITPDN